MKINYRILWLSFIFSFVETVHFGWDVTAESDAEEICDGIAIILLAMSIL